MQQMRALVFALATLILLTGCGPSDGGGHPSSKPKFVGPETTVPTLAPVKVTAKKYGDCAHATTAFHKQMARAVRYGSLGEIPELVLAIRRGWKTIRVNEDCFPARQVAQTPADPDVVEVVKLPEAVEREASERCKPVLREAQTLLNFTGGWYSSGDRENTSRLRQGFTKLSEKHPKCLPPRIAKKFDDAVERPY
jgi:hypothetical protein